MPTIYDRHDAAFRLVSAYAILDNDGDVIATVSIKFPGPRSLRLTAFVHWHGEEMVVGTADGGGYDKSSAAVAKAVRKMPRDTRDITVYGEAAMRARFIAECRKDDGNDWTRQLRDAGFKVIQAL
jgi:hypothetical protein